MVDPHDEEEFDPMLESFETELFDEAELHTEEDLIEHPGEFDPVADLGENLFAHWCDSFLRTSVNNQFYASGAFHLLFGQLPNIRNIKIQRGNSGYIDPRVHLAFLAPSASGKGEGLKFITRMCTMTGIHLQSVGRVTDAALLGTWRRGEEGELNYSPGWLHPDSGIDILSASEATNIIKDPDRDREAAELMNTLQSVMNDMDSPDNLISKKLAEGEPIEFYPRCSLLLTTFPPSYFDEILLERGLFQRMYLHIKESDQKTREKEKKQLRQIQKERIDTTPIEERVAACMLYIDRCYMGVEEMWPSSGALHMFEEQDHEIERMMSQFTPAVQEMLQPFTGRFNTLYQKIAMHFACLNLHRRIERVDAELATAYTNRLFESIVVGLYLRSKPNEKTEKMVGKIFERTKAVIEELQQTTPGYMKTKGFVHNTAIVKKLKKSYRMPENVARTYIEKLDAWNFGEQVEKSGVMFFRMKGELPEGDS